MHLRMQQITSAANHTIDKISDKIQSQKSATPNPQINIKKPGKTNIVIIRLMMTHGVSKRRNIRAIQKFFLKYVSLFAKRVCG